MTKKSKYKLDDYQKLTVNLIRTKYFNKPIKVIYGQDIKDFKNPLISETILEFTGDLIIGNLRNKQIKVENWLYEKDPKFKPGPYTENGSNNQIFFYLELKNEDEDFGKYIQIGFNELINNYITFNAINGLDVWVKK